MGLTIHYDLTSRTRSPEKAKGLVEKMRQLALDLPVEEVSDIITLEGEQRDVELQRGKVDEPLFWLLIQSSQHVKCPWNPNVSRNVNPTRLIAFNIFPGPGSEPANIGLCQYRKEIEWEDRKVRTGLGGWHWSSFCKTQYASNPQCGGVANFLRCHISIITLLDRIAKLPTMTVEINDEGNYGPSNFTDDPSVPKPHYYLHEGKYDPKALAEEVGEWNSMIAAQFGALSDMLSGSGMEGSSPIHDFPNFEQLEFRGAQQEHLQPFLRGMAKLAEQERAKHEA